MLQRHSPSSAHNASVRTSLRCAASTLARERPTRSNAPDSLLVHAVLLLRLSTIDYGLHAAPRSMPTLTPFALRRGKPSERIGSLSSVRALPRDRGGMRHALDERRHREVYGGRMRDGFICCSSGLHLRGAREYGWLRTGLLRTVALLVLMGYTRGKMRCTGLAQMLERRLLFSHILPINGLCFIRVVSATPPSIVIVAPVLGGPECVRALCWKAAAHSGRRFLLYCIHAMTPLGV